MMMMSDYADLKDDLTEDDIRYLLFYIDELQNLVEEFLPCWLSMISVTKAAIERAEDGNDDR
jgi:hypothetical protein